MVNGENPHVGFDFYRRHDRARCTRRCPTCTSSATRRREIHHMTTLSGLTHEQVLRELRPPGSARCRAAAPRSSPTACASSSRPARSIRTSGSTSTTPRTGSGIPTHCTMLYGHVETYEERVDHLLRLRDQQDETGGFLAFIPLAFHPENTVFERRGWRHTTGCRRPEDARGLPAAARQHPEREGLLDHDGHAAGAGRAPLRRERRPGHASSARRSSTRRRATEQEQKLDQLVRFVREAGRIPVQRDTLYNELRRWAVIRCRALDARALRGSGGSTAESGALAAADGKAGGRPRSLGGRPAAARRSATTPIGSVVPVVRRHGSARVASSTTALTFRGA